MMWHRFAGVLLTLSCLGVSGCGAINSVFNRTLSAEELDKIAREITVIIEGCGGGSGVLYKREGDTYTVLTANHVISNETLTCLITTPDGKEYKATKQINRPIQGLDIAMLKFTSNADYKLAEVGDSTQLKGGEQIYIGGAPGVDATNSKRAIRVSQGNLLSDSVKSGFEGLEYLIFYDSNTLPGMSGGTALNHQGKVVGVHVMGSRGTMLGDNGGINSGIPIHVLNTSKYTSQVINEIDKVFFEATSERDFDKKIQKWTKAIQLKPSNALFYFYRGQLYRDQREHDKALADITKSITLAPNFVDAYLYRADTLNRDKKDEALADYTQVITLRPKDYTAYLHRSYLYSAYKDNDKALADFNKAITLNPKILSSTHDSKYSSSNYAFRGLIYHRKEKYDEALADYTQAINLDPKNADAYNNRGLVYHIKGDINKALADYTQSITLRPNNTIAYGNRGNVYYHREELDKALTDYTQAISLDPLDPKNAEAYHRRGIIYDDKGDKDKALADFKKAVNLFQQQGDFNQASISLYFIKSIEGN